MIYDSTIDSNHVCFHNVLCLFAIVRSWKSNRWCYTNFLLFIWWFSETNTNSYVYWRSNRLIDWSLCVELNESSHFTKNDEDWNFLKERALRRLQVDVASFYWWTKMRLTRKTLKRHCIHYECWRYVDHLNWTLICTCLRKRSRSINYWRSILCWHKSTLKRFFSFHIKNENRLKTNCTTSKRKRCVKIFESSIYHILWFENSLIKKSWFRSCWFSRCIVILRMWFFLSLFWVSRALRVRVALTIAWCRLIEWFSQTRRRFEFVSKKSHLFKFYIHRFFHDQRRQQHDYTTQ